MYLNSRRSSLQSISPRINFLDFPHELILEIVLYLKKEDRCRLRLTCRILRNVIDRPCVWANVTVNLLGVNLYTAWPGYPKIWDTLRTRRLTRLHLNYPTLQQKDFFSVLQCCPSLKYLETTCNFLHYLPGFPKRCISGLRAICVDLVRCWHGLNSVCMKQLVLLPNLNSLSLHDRSSVMAWAPFVLKYVQSLTALEELVIKTDEFANLSYSFGVLLKETISQLPNLRRLQLQNISHSYSDAFYLTALDHLRLTSLKINHKVYTQDLEQVLPSLASLQILSMVICLMEWSRVLKTVKINLPNLVSLGLKATNAAQAPVGTFDMRDIPTCLTSLSIRCVFALTSDNKSTGVISSLPAVVRPRIKHLHLGDIKLTKKDLIIIGQDFINLQTASFSVSGHDCMKDTGEDHVGHSLCELSRLRHLYHIKLLHINQSRLSSYVKRLRHLSDNRIRIEFSQKNDIWK